MKSERLLFMLGDISDDMIEETARRVGQGGRTVPFPRPRRIVRKVVISVAAVLVLTLGTFAAAMAVDEEFREAVFAFFYTEQAGQTRVLTEDTALTDCYSYVYSVPGDYSTYEWIQVDSEWVLCAGDILVVLEEADGMSRVVVPYGDVPWLYGFVASDLLSKDRAKIEQGNQAIITDCDCYDSAGGSILQTSSGRVQVLSRDGEWACVQTYGTGEEPCWVRSDDLEFDFDGIILDLPE